jgi:hypothetical protein
MLNSKFTNRNIFVSLKFIIIAKLINDINVRVIISFIIFEKVLCWFNFYLVFQKIFRNL